MADEATAPRTDDPDRLDLYLLAFGEARRRVDVEAAALENTRARAGTLLSAAAVVAALMAGPLLEGGLSELAGVGKLAVWVAVATFVTVAAATISIWWPAASTDTLSARVIIDEYIESDRPAGVSETYSLLAQYVDDHANTLADTVRTKVWLFEVAAAGFAVMVLLLPLVAWDASA